MTAFECENQFSFFFQKWIEEIIFQLSCKKPVKPFTLDCPPAALQKLNC